jgi:2Fe-2S ferredoxin
MNPEREPTSRLSCQMDVSATWDGLIVQTPEFQM